ncbi:MAG: WD40/YVTN/BNR-like repeat-containing protein [Candidatus Limnocylindrales bacterium]
MSDYVFDLDFEAELRAELRRSIVPPATPEYVRDAVERLAAPAIARGAGRRTFDTWPLGILWLRRAVAAAAAAAVIAAVLLWRSAQMALVPAFPSTYSPVPTPASSITPGTMLDVGVTADGGGFVYIEGDGLRVTTDRGVTWSEARRVPASDSVQDHVWDVTSLEFIDHQRGWMTGVTNGAGGSQVVVHRTIDGGRTWQTAPVASLRPDPSPSAAGSFVGAQDHFWDALHGRVVVERIVPNGAVANAGCQWYATDDGGVSWSGPSAGSCMGLSPTVRWTSPAIGYAVNLTPPSVSVTQDGGQTWITGSLPGQTPGRSITPELLVADGAGHLTLVAETSPGPVPELVFGSSDGGATWSMQPAMTLPAGFDTVDWVSASGPDRWVVVAENAATLVPPGTPPATAPTPQYGNRQLLETTDGGRTWSFIGNADFPGGGLYWWDDQHGMTAGGPSAAVFVTLDGGRTWLQVKF